MYCCCCWFFFFGKFSLEVGFDAWNILCACCHCVLVHSYWVFSLAYLWQTFTMATISLQNRLLAMNYINEGNDDKLFEAHRYGYITNLKFQFLQSFTTKSFNFIYNEIPRLDMLSYFCHYSQYGQHLDHLYQLQLRWSLYTLFFLTMLNGTSLWLILFQCCY